MKSIVFLENKKKCGNLLTYGYENYQIRRFKNIGDAEEDLADKIGVSVRMLRGWKNEKPSQKLDKIEDKFFFALIGLILSAEKGWKVSDISRLEWLIDLWQGTSEDIPPEFDEAWLRNILNRANDGSRTRLSEEQIRQIIEFTFYQNTTSRAEQQAKDQVQEYKTIGYTHFRRSAYDIALDYLQEGLGIAVAYHLLLDEADCQVLIGLCLIFKSDFVLAEDHLQKARVIFETLKNKNGEATFLRNLGLLYEQKKEHELAVQFYSEAYQLALEVSDKKTQALALGDLGNEKAYRQDYIGAIKDYYRALRIAKQLNDPNIINVQLGNLGFAYDELCRYKEALTWYAQALGLARYNEDRYNEAIHLGNIGDIYRERFKQYRDAHKYFNQALTITRLIGNKQGELEYLKSIAQVFEGEENCKGAIDSYKEALKIAQQIGDNQNEKIILDALLKLGNECKE